MEKIKIIPTPTASQGGKENCHAAVYLCESKLAPLSSFYFFLSFFLSMWTSLAGC